VALQSRRKYKGSDLLGDLMLDDIDLLELEYRSSFKKFLCLTNEDFEILLKKLGLKVQRRMQTVDMLFQ
jgi:hypothetical protein